MKESHKYGQFFFRKIVSLKSIFVLAVMSFQLTKCSSPTFKTKGYAANTSKNTLVRVDNSLPISSPVNMELKVEYNASEMNGILTRLDHLENHFIVLNDQVAEQKGKIANLESIVDHLQSNQKEKEEIGFELKENEVKFPHERFKRQNKKSSFPVAVPPICKKEACAFDYSRSTTLQLIKTFSLESISLPKNCSNLGQMGYTLSGIYAVQGSDANQNEIALTYCHFNSPLLKQNKDVPEVLEKPLGFLKLGSSPIRPAFFAQMDRNFPGNNNVVLFTYLQINDGDAMDLKTGIFTAPVAGTYTFHFGGIFGEGWSRVFLKKNNDTIGSTFRKGAGQDTLTLSALLKLVPGDKICLFKSGTGSIIDDHNRQTFFSGWFIEGN